MRCDAIPKNLKCPPMSPTSHPSEFPNAYSLAIETSSAIDSIAVGCGDELLETVTLPERAAGRSSSLMAYVSELFERLDIDRRQLKEIYVSVGPGSFTGLRIGLATAQMLAKVLDAKTVAVPTIEVVAENVSVQDRSLLVCLNQKRETVYTAMFRSDDSNWKLDAPASVQSIDRILADSPRPLQLLSQTRLDLSEVDLAEIDVLPIELAMPSAAVVWKLGRDAAKDGAYTAGSQLLPIYARIPEAVELWNKRHK